uniref:Uncharacterized protein n=1 Tax=Moniliophthora roreri TaxID=221103 RepID=A0A0W0FR11_MONRR
MIKPNFIIIDPTTDPNVEFQVPTSHYSESIIPRLQVASRLRAFSPGSGKKHVGSAPGTVLTSKASEHGKGHWRHRSQYYLNVVDANQGRRPRV